MEAALRSTVQKRLLQFQEDLWRTHHTEPPETLYHYSPPLGVRGILEAHELWVSSIQRLNDKRDGVYSLDVFWPILRRKSVPDPVRDLFGRELRRIGEIWFLYVASFCAAKDLESQWKNYGADGTGCAIAVNLERLFEKSSNGKDFALFRVLYDEGDQRVKAEKTIDHAIGLSRELEISKRDLNAFWIEAMIYSLLPCGVRFKNPSYTSEQEWRILMIRADQSTANTRTLPDGVETTYLKLPLDRTLIDGVLLGPQCSYTTEEMKAMLVAGGFVSAGVEASRLGQR